MGTGRHMTPGVAGTPWPMMRTTCEGVWEMRLPPSDPGGHDPRSTPSFGVGAGYVALGILSPGSVFERSMEKTQFAATPLAQ